MVDTAEQRRSGIEDSVELAWHDWQAIASFEDEDVWPRRWAEQYVARARDEVGGWLKQHGVWFFPVERMCEDERKYSWLVCNWKIACRELDVSGSAHNPLIREKRLARFLLSVVAASRTSCATSRTTARTSSRPTRCPSWRGG